MISKIKQFQIFHKFRVMKMGALHPAIGSGKVCFSRETTLALVRLSQQQDKLVLPIRMSFLFKAYQGPGSPQMSPGFSFYVFATG